jgi:hypothetical protein
MRTNDLDTRLAYISEMNKSEIALEVGSTKMEFYVDDAHTHKQVYTQA